MVGQNGRQRRLHGFKELNRNANSVLAPRLPTCMRMGIQHELVITDDPDVESFLQCLPLTKSRAAEAVVIEQKHRHDSDWPPRPIPHRVWILRGYDAERAAALNEVHISSFSTKPGLSAADYVQFMVARRPHHGAKGGFERAQSPFEQVHVVCDVPCDQQPIRLIPGPEPFQCLAILLVLDMNIADGEQLALTQADRSRFACSRSPWHPVPTRVFASFRQVRLPHRRILPLPP